MRTVPLLVCSLAFALTAPAILAGQTVWKWVDAKGVTHYSDQPIPGATKMELSSSSPSSSPVPEYSAPTPAADPQPKQAAAYERFAITQPQQDEAVVNTGGQVQVSLAATPAVRSGHSISLLLDGAPVEDYPQAALSHELSNVPRGTHTLRAVISTAQGQVIQETPPVTFHVRQTSAVQPPVGPAMRPPPKRPGGAMNKMPTTQPSYAALNGKSTGPIDPRTNQPMPPSKTLPTGPRSGN